MRSSETGHAACVSAWLDRTIPEPRSVPAATLLSLFELALTRLWQRAQVTLGEVTMSAIGDRVLYTAAEQYAVLGSLTVDHGPPSFDELRRQTVHDPAVLHGAIRYVLVEFLTVVGNLTDEILTPGLHSELARITLDDGAKEAQS